MGLTDAERYAVRKVVLGDCFYLSSTYMPKYSQIYLHNGTIDKAISCQNYWGWNWGLGYFWTYEPTIYLYIDDSIDSFLTANYIENLVEDYMANNPGVVLNLIRY